MLNPRLEETDNDEQNKFTALSADDLCEDQCDDFDEYDDHNKYEGCSMGFECRCGSRAFELVMFPWGRVPDFLLSCTGCGGVYTEFLIWQQINVAREVLKEMETEHNFWYA